MLQHQAPLHQPHHSLRRRIVPALIVASLVLGACGASNADEAGTTDDNVVRSAGAEGFSESVSVTAGPLPTIISTAFQAFSFLKKCLDNQANGEECLANDSSRIKDTLKQVKAMRAEIERNQQQALAEFDSIRNLIRNQSIRSLAENLRPMVVNAELAMMAYEALADCAVSTDGTCRPFIGRDGDQPVPVAEAIEMTEGYFLEKAGNLPSDLPVTASWFTGTSPRYDDGLAEAIWMYNKGLQDVAAGVTDSKIKDARTVPVLTRTLSDTTNQDLGYWGDVFGEYAFLAVTYAGFSGGAPVAQRRQAEADSRIGSTASRQSVMGSVNYYALPALPSNGVVLSNGSTAWLVTPATGAGRPLTPNDVLDLRTIVGAYTSIDKFSQIPGALPPDGWYSVATPIERVSYQKIIVEYRLDGVEWNNVDAAWLVDPANATDSCSSKVRPTTNPPAKPVAGLWPYIFDSVPKITPENRIKLTWERFAANKPIEYSWAPYKATEFGLGAWIACDDVAPGSLVTLLKVPSVMNPAG
jgi:hypothetical protein